MDTLEISLNKEFAHKPTISHKMSWGHFTFSDRKYTFPFVLQQIPSSSNKTNSTAPPPLSEQCCVIQSLQTQPASNNDWGCGGGKGSLK